MASWKQERFVCIGNGNFFLNRKAASVHNAKNERCRGKGIKCITVETRHSDLEVVPLALFQIYGIRSLVLIKTYI